MRTGSNVLLALILFSIPSICYGQGNNTKIVKSTEAEDINTLMTLYAKDAVMMPEYHSGIYGKKDIEKFYKQRFQQSDITDYTRTMHDYKQVGDYVVETGTFSYNYTGSAKHPFLYSAKYMIIWQPNKKHQLQIISEIWGSVQHVERSRLQFSEDGHGYHAPPEPKLENDVSKQVQNRNDQISQAVKKRDAITLGDMYTKDAIYMPYYSPMISGNEKIKEYYNKHEDPSVTIDSVQIKISRITISGAYAIVEGRYGVNWRSGNNTGKVTGKSINVWVQNHGKYFLYRQMVNHD